MRAPLSVEASPPSTLTRDLLNGLRQGVQAAQRAGQPIVYSLSLPAAAPEMITLFESAQRLAGEACLWSPPGQDFSLVGLGAAWALELPEPDRFQQAARAWRRVMAGALSEGQPGESVGCISKWWRVAILSGSGG
jgi:hypothetical protein